MTDADYGEQGQQEVEYVDECPSCGTRFIGMSPDEVRDAHAEDCTKILRLVVFPDDE